MRRLTVIVHHGPGRASSGTLDEPPMRVLDVLEALDLDVPFSCRDANCGTCAVRVVSSTVELAPPGADERSTAARLNLAEGTRLACQLSLTSGFTPPAAPLVSRPDEAGQPEAQLELALAGDRR